MIIGGYDKRGSSNDVETIRIVDDKNIGISKCHVPDYPMTIYFHAGSILDNNLGTKLVCDWYAIDTPCVQTWYAIGTEMERHGYAIGTVIRTKVRNWHKLCGLGTKSITVGTRIIM